MHDAEHCLRVLLVSSVGVEEVDAPLVLLGGNEGEPYGEARDEGDHDERIAADILPPSISASVEDSAEEEAPRYQPARISALIISAAFSPIMMVGALVLPPISVGITDASTTRRPSRP